MILLALSNILFIVYAARFLVPPKFTNPKRYPPPKLSFKALRMKKPSKKRIESTRPVEVDLARHALQASDIKVKWL